VLSLLCHISHIFSRTFSIPVLVSLHRPVLPYYCILIAPRPETWPVTAAMQSWPVIAAMQQSHCLRRRTMTLFWETPCEFGNVPHLKVIGRYVLLFVPSFIHLLTPHFMYNTSNCNYENGELIIIIIIIIITIQPLHALIMQETASYGCCRWQCVTGNRLLLV
jgi:hypothetical protein